MTDDDKKKLIQLREFARKQYESLEGRGNSTSQMKVNDAAWMLSSIVKSLDDLLRDHVTFVQKS